MTRRNIAVLAAALAVATLAGAVPAEAGRRTGTWLYSPEEIYAQAEAQRRAQWHEFHRHQEWEARQEWGPRQDWGRQQWGRQDWGPHQDWGPRYGHPVEQRWYGPRDDAYLYGD